MLRSRDVRTALAPSQIVLVEAKLWRNPEARRVVVSQILDYAKQLTRWRYEDLDAAVAKATGLVEFLATFTNRMVNALRGRIEVFLADK